MVWDDTNVLASIPITIYYSVIFAQASSASHPLINYYYASFVKMILKLWKWVTAYDLLQFGLGKYIIFKKWKRLIATWFRSWKIFFGVVVPSSPNGFSSEPWSGPWSCRINCKLQTTYFILFFIFLLFLFLYIRSKEVYNTQAQAVNWRFIWPCPLEII